MDFDLNKAYPSDNDDDTFSGNCSVHAYGSDSHGESEESLVKSTVHLDSTADENLCDGDGYDEKQCSSGGVMDTGPECEIEDRDDSVEALKKIAEEKIEVGSVIDTLDNVYELYCEYAKLMGFSVRKGTQSYFLPSMEVRVKVYHCSCEGPADNKCSVGRIAAYKKQTYRSNCKARLRVAREDLVSPWKVSVLEKQHNHDLVHPSESYLLRSARNMSQSKKTLFTAMQSSGIGVSRAYRFVEEEAGGRENIGFIRKDVYNELHRETKKLSKGDNADVNKLMDYFTNKGLTDPSFYWKVKVSDDGRLKNLLFRDSRCLIDYQHFGDVVSVDATYKTNKYGLICVPIVGINHHRTNVMFAIAFLSNEKIESYEWLFSTFLESMYQKEPSIIFSDQDQALMNGVDYTFREASHRLCQWHINKNAVKHFGKLNHNSNFKRMWFRCMNGCESEEQFEATWRSMIEEHGLLENRWFCSMYHLRKRWSSAFTGDKFCGGLHATSRSEVTNKVLKDLCSSTSSVIDFVVGFERMQKSWRRREFEEDSFCRGMPGMFVQRTSILLQVGELCTRNIFKSFEYEALNSISVTLTHEPPDMNEENLEFKVSSRTAVIGHRVVKFNQRTEIASCSCHMWETEGVLCRHLFRVYFHLNFVRIPDEMILNRWRRDSKQRLGCHGGSVDCLEANKFSNMVFVNHNSKLVYDLLTESKNNKVCRDAINECIQNMVESVNKLRHEGKGSQKIFEGGLHRPLRNPNLAKKRPYRRKKFSKHWAGRGSEEPKIITEDEDLQEYDKPVPDTQLPSYQANLENFDDTVDRFSVD